MFNAKLIQMAKLAKKIETEGGLKLEIVNPNAAGIDVSATELQVCVPVGRATPNNRVFGVYTQDLHEISSWLRGCGVTTVAMESTGIYWLPLFRVLDDDGFDVILVNALDVKNYSGRKTDEADAEWLMVLHSYGLMKPCYQPDSMSRQLRNLSRHRESLVMSSSREVLHLQKSMEQMNLKLDNVFSDILGESGQRIIEAILAGERDAERLASLADRRCRKSREEIMLSLEATWDEEHLFVMRQSHDIYLYYQRLIEECDREMESLLARYVVQVDAGDAEFVRSGKRKQRKSGVGMDIERYAYDLWGVNVMNVPGISHASLMKLVAELGAGFTLKFADAKHFVSWANLVPNNKISGGKLLSSKVPKRPNPVGIVFRQCANTLKSSKEPLGDYFRHIKARSGHLQAMVATGKKLATIFYTMVSRRAEYDVGEYSKHRKSRLDRDIIRLRDKLERLENEQTRAICKIMENSLL